MRNIKQNKTKIETLFFIILLIIIFSFLSIFVAAPPTPHSVNGYIKYINGSQVPRNTSYIVNVSNSSSTIFLKQSKTSFPFPGFSGYYSESVSGTDGDLLTITAWNGSLYGVTITNLIGTMNGINVTLNLTRDPEPTVNITTPNDNTLKNDSTFFTIYSNLTLYGQNSTNCKAEISFSNSSVLAMYNNQPTLLSFGTLPISYSILYSWNVSGIGIGSSNVTINFTCDSMFGTKFEFLNYTDTLINLTIHDTTPPNITLFSPNKGQILNNTLIDFNYTISDLSEISECNLYVDGSILQTEVLPLKNVNLSFQQSLSQGLHFWNITCTDNSPLNNFGFSETRNFTIDSIPPEIILINPSNNIIRSNNTIDFIYKVIDYGMGIKNCTLFLNGSILFFNSNILNDTNIVNITTLLMGNYYFEVGCFDNIGNYNISEKYYFEITDPDIFISNQKISFDYTSLVEGSIATISANITNIGNENASNFIVQFYLGDPDNGGVQLGNDQTINFIDKFESILLYQTLNLSRGDNRVFVVVDTPISSNGVIEEANELNNKANNSLLVSSWQIYYGYRSLNILIGGADSSLMMGWSVENSGNLIFVEEGTNFLWTDFVALGRNISGDESSNDFLEADIVLNLTGNSDSIYNSYTNQGIAYNLINFTIVGSEVNFVPVSNSTNNSNFMTGILWDKGDGGVEYDGSQDLLFITKTNHANGKYGIYDYEVKIPGSLKNYKLNSGRVTIYSELV